MTDSPAIARQLYEALATGDGPALDALLDPAFRGVLADGMPFGAGGGHDGADAMRRDGWAVIGRHFAARAEPERFTALEDGRLLVTGRYGGRGRHGGGPLDAAFAHVLSIAHGRVTALEQYTDTARWERAASPFSTLALQVVDGVATVRLDRPDRGNAIDPAMTRDLAEVATRLREDDAVRAVLLAGNGPMFTAGGDLALLSGLPADELPRVLRRMIDDYHLALARLSALDAPIVAAVHGAAAGGGLGMVHVADIVIASEEATFALGYGGIGLTSDGGNTWYLPRLVGMRRAQELFLLNHRFSAAEALEWGLVTRVVPAADVEAEAGAVVARLAAGPTRAFGGMRRLLRQSLETGLRDQLAAEQDLIVEACTTPDAAEGLAAFIGKRRPQFTGHRSRETP
ncbi:enoyl-CoA hydratase-related protein [Pseudonocardia broussonetiae]|uniref:SnoaL-like domain-containing protein n=1 Tax=Pseudonocardia broussonetiae TaxID=2736640 RepID=A0A6M6JMG1_9PSEU|nr:enoyl-CoA hydratase-related protein [Pseudonocardia broussonetiae]QJY47481.1 SnoaL-like domain-containing protein [Pseudonocardia broussonetiae]